MSIKNKLKKNITKITVITSVCIIALVGTVMASSIPIAEETPVTPSSTNSEVVADYIDWETAKTIVLAKVPNATIHKINFKNDDNRAEYEGEAYLDNVQYDFKIDALTGEVFEWKNEVKSTTPKAASDATSSAPTVADKSSDTTTKDKTSTYVGEAAAKNTALKEIPGATITEIDLEYDDGRVECEIEMYLNNTEYKFTIDAVTGNILERESDKNDDCGDDDDTEDDD